jgi:beta-galactosidase
LHFHIEGAGKIIATANANPSDMESFQHPQHKTFEGKCLVIVQPKGKAGIIKLKAEGEGLESGEVIIDSK